MKLTVEFDKQLYEENFQQNYSNDKKGEFDYHNNGDGDYGQQYSNQG